MDPPFILQEGKSKDSLVVFLRSLFQLNTCLKEGALETPEMGWLPMCQLGRHLGGVTWKLESRGGLGGGREAESPSELSRLKAGGLWVVTPPLTSHCVRSVAGEGHHPGSDRYLCWRKVHRGAQAANTPSGWRTEQNIFTLILHAFWVLTNAAFCMEQARISVE